MFNRIKGVVDYVDQRFQEEQARAKAAQGQIARSNSTARKPDPKGTPRHARSASTDRRLKESTGKGPDPKEFDPELVDDESEPSRTGTPGPSRGQEAGPEVAGTTATDNAEGKTGDLPQDVRVKIRKLERLELKYQELLRSYRIAHARVGVIEPFEAALRENTPLTSINDPSALTEYLNQINVKGDMVLDELKRVSAESNSFKQKMDEAEKDARKAWDEVAQLKSKSPTTANSSEAKGADSGDLFSYDDEVPRLEKELKQSQEEAQQLKGRVATLQDELKTAKETTESMATNLEVTTKELNGLRDARRESEEQSRRLMAELETADAKYRKLEHEHSSAGDAAQEEAVSQLKQAKEEIEELQRMNKENEAKIKSVGELRADLERVTKEAEENQAQQDLRASVTRKLMDDLKQDLGQAQELATVAAAEKQELERLLQEAREAKRLAEESKADATKHEDEDAAKSVVDEGEGDKAEAGKKNKKKKKKGGKGASAAAEVLSKANGASQAQQADGAAALAAEAAADGKEAARVKERLEKALSELQEKDAAIDRLEARLKEQGTQQEEIDFLRDELKDAGQELVEAREKIKELQLEKDGLHKTIEELRNELVEVRGSHASSSAETEKAQKDLAAQFEDLKIKSKTLETDLAVAQQLASSRFKDLSELREKMQRAQPEIKALQTENAELKKTKKELDEKLTALDRLQIKHDSLQSQVADLKKGAAEKSKEINSLNTKLGSENDSRQKLESEGRKLRGDLSSAQSEAKNASQSLERVSNELAQARQTVRRHEARIRELEGKLSSVEAEQSRLKEELELKSAQYVSAESLMNSMRDQTSEMATQLKEARERCDSLDEEVADAHRLLTERTREGETMRRLLAEVETRTDSRVREMRDRMETAIEERERMEDETSASNRRRAREVEEARSRLREVERDLRLAQEARDELDEAQRDWKRRREELEQFVERNNAEAEEAKTAMGRIRDALDESEKQARELEKQKLDLRRTLEESKTQLDKLDKRNKALGEEVKTLQSKPKAVLNSPTPSSPAGSRVMSPAGRREISVAAPEPITQGVYIKSVLLQFRERKEKKHQVQFVPTLANLLQLDNADQQKLTAAIMSK